MEGDSVWEDMHTRVLLADSLIHLAVEELQAVFGNRAPHFAKKFVDRVPLLPGESDW